MSRQCDSNEERFKVFSLMQLGPSRTICTRMKPAESAWDAVESKYLQLTLPEKVIIRHLVVPNIELPECSECRKVAQNVISHCVMKCPNCDVELGCKPVILNKSTIHDATRELSAKTCIRCEIDSVGMLTAGVIEESNLQPKILRSMRDQELIDTIISIHRGGDIY